MTLKSAFFISPPYIVPRMSTRRRLNEMPTKTDEGAGSCGVAPSGASSAGNSPHSTTVKPGAKPSSSTGSGRTNRVCAKSACHDARATTRMGTRYAGSAPT